MWLKILKVLLIYNVIKVVSSEKKLIFTLRDFIKVSWLLYYSQDGGHEIVSCSIN